MVIGSRTGDGGRVPVRRTVLGVGAEFKLRFESRVHCLPLPPPLVPGQTALDAEADDRLLIQFHKTGPMHYSRSKRGKGSRLISKANRCVSPVLDLARYRWPLIGFVSSLAGDFVFRGPRGLDVWHSIRPSDVLCGMRLHRVVRGSLRVALRLVLHLDSVLVDLGTDDSVVCLRDSARVAAHF